MPRSISVRLMLATAAVWICWDVAALLWGGPQATISAITLGGAERYHAIPWGWGVLAGHFFGPRNAERSARSKLTGMGVLIAQFALMLWLLPAMKVPLLAFVAVGVAQGVLMWPQGAKSGD